MKRKVLIGVIASSIFIGGIVGGVTVSKNIVSETGAISNVNENNDLEDNEKIEDDNDLGGNKNSINEINDKYNESVNIQENNEQTLLEGYEIFSKVKDAYNAGEYEEALNLYNTITNSEALAKVEFFKEELDYYIGLYNFIDEAKELYESGKYELARVVLYNVTGSNASNKQREITNDLLSKIEDKIRENGEKEFTFELAVEYLKASMAHTPGYEYEPWIMEISSDGTRRWLVTAKDFGYVYSIDEYGRIDTD